MLKISQQIKGRYFDLCFRKFFLFNLTGMYLRSYVCYCIFSENSISWTEDNLEWNIWNFHLEILLQIFWGIFLVIFKGLMNPEVIFQGKPKHSRFRPLRILFLFFGLAEKHKQWINFLTLDLGSWFCTFPKWSFIYLYIYMYVCLKMCILNS